MLKWLIAGLVIWAVWKLLAKPKRGSLVQTPTSAQRHAMSLLGVAAAADDQAIREAHRRKVAEAHPDRGGSVEVTRELNAARDLLLRDR